MTVTLETLGLQGIRDNIDREVQLTSTPMTMLTKHVLDVVVPLLLRAIVVDAYPQLAILVR